MAITLADLKKLAAACGLKFHEREPDELIFSFRTDRYADDEGKKHIFIVAQILEDGRYLRIMAPLAFKTEGEHTDAFLKACMMAQWKTKLVQFEYDSGDGEIRPVVEFPIEDGTITAEQLSRCVRGLAGLVDDLYPTLKRAREEGIVLFDQPAGRPYPLQLANLDSLIAEFAARPNADPELLGKLRALRATLAGEPDPGPPTAV